MNYLRTAAIGSGLAGVSHMTLQAYSHFGMHFYFIGFLAVGLVQILLGVLLWKGKLTRELFWLTTLVNGGATIFWLLTRTMTAPFMGGVEHFTAVGLTVVALQVISIICVCLEQKKLINFILVLLGSLGIGFTSHFGAMQMEAAFPEMKIVGGHHGEDQGSTMSAEEHSKMMNDHEETTESLIEDSIETEAETKTETETNTVDDNHDEPHGH